MIKEDYYKIGELELYYRYYDKNGKEITPGCFIKNIHNGTINKVYPTDLGTLGVDATNPRWIELGRAEPCEYGIYDLTETDCKCNEVIENYEEPKIKKQHYETVITFRFTGKPGELKSHCLINQLIAQKECIEYSEKVEEVK